MNEKAEYLGHPRVYGSVFREVGVFPCLLATHLGLSQTISNNVWFLLNQLSISCEGSICVKEVALSCLVLLADLSKSRGWVGP